MMSAYRRHVAAFTCSLSFALVAPPSAVGAEDLERVFVGVPNQLTLPPDFRDEAVPNARSQAGLECKAATEHDTLAQLDGACTSEARVRPSPRNDEPSPDAKSADLGNALAKGGTDTGEPVR